MLAEQSALEAVIVDACTKHEETHSGYHRCVSAGTDHLVKYKDLTSLWLEFVTQKYIFEYTETKHAAHFQSDPPL